MAYVNPNFKTKKALKEALKEGRRVEVFQPGMGTEPLEGSIALEGPHYPEPHTWYAVGIREDGELGKVK